MMRDSGIQFGTAAEAALSDTNGRAACMPHGATVLQTGSMQEANRFNSRSKAHNP